MSARSGNDNISLTRAGIFSNRRAWIGRTTMFLGISIFVAGCLSAQVVPTRDPVSSIRSIEISAMEPPPLTLTAEPGNPAFLAGVYGPGAGALVLVYGVVVTVKGLKDHGVSTKKSVEYREMLSRKGTWIPTMVLAGQAAGMLGKNGKKNISIGRECIGIPDLENRETTFFMENWYAPIRAWYNADLSTVRRADGGDNGPDAILEIGMLNYEFYGNHLLLQVMAKLVDPGTGRVLGKSRSTDMLQVNEVEDLFLHDAEGFKNAFTALGGRLLKESLERLSLLP